MSALWQVKTLKNRDLTLHFLPGIGGRLWDIEFHGRSLLFQNSGLAGVDPDLDQLHRLPTKSPHFKFPLWGGEKTWVAPDSAWQAQAPYAMLDSGPYSETQIDDQRIVMESAVCPQSQLQVRRSFNLESAEQWSVQHSLVNCGSTTRFAGIWSVMMLKRPAEILSQIEAGSSATEVFGHSIGCYRLNQRNAIFQCERPQEFKLGVSNPTGTMFIQVGHAQQAVYLSCQNTPAHGDQHFAHGHNVEVFNSGNYDYCEAEWHSPAVDLEPDQSLHFYQAFNISSSAPRPM